MQTEMIEIPKAEYDRLITIADKMAEAADVEEVNQALAELAAGTLETYPADLVDRLLEGGNPIREFRKYRNLTGAELAKATGVTQGYISELETGKKEGTVSTLRKIADVLKVSLEELV